MDLTAAVPGHMRTAMSQLVRLGDAETGGIALCGGSGVTWLPDSFASCFRPPLDQAFLPRRCVLLGCGDRARVWPASAFNAAPGFGRTAPL